MRRQREGRGGPGGRGIVFRRSGRRLSFFCYYVINQPSRRCLSHEPPSLPLAPHLLPPPPPPPMTLLYPDSFLPAPDDCDIGPFTPFVDKLARRPRLPQRPHCRVSKNRRDRVLFDRLLTARMRGVALDRCVDEGAGRRQDAAMPKNPSFADQALEED